MYCPSYLISKIKTIYAYFDTHIYIDRLQIKYTLPDLDLERR